MAEVTGQKSKPHQLEDMLRRVLTTAELLAVTAAGEKLLQQLVRETPSQPTTVVSPQCRRHWNRCYALSSTDSAGDSGNLCDNGNLRGSNPPDETGWT